MGRAHGMNTGMSGLRASSPLTSMSRMLTRMYDAAGSARSPSVSLLTRAPGPAWREGVTGYRSSDARLICTEGCALAYAAVVEDDPEIHLRMELNQRNGRLERRATPGHGHARAPARHGTAGARGHIGARGRWARAPPLARDRPSTSAAVGAAASAIGLVISRVIG